MAGGNACPKNFELNHWRFLETAAMQFLEGRPPCRPHVERDGRDGARPSAQS